MIHSLTLYKERANFTNKLYKYKGELCTFNFTDGINIITGRNGSGKSVLLKILKHKCGIHNATYPTFIEPLTLFGLFSDDKTDISLIQKWYNGKYPYAYPKSNIQWSGDIAHYLTKDNFSSSVQLDNIMQDRRSIMNMGEALSTHMSTLSMGESLMWAYRYLFKLQKEYDEPLTCANDRWIAASNLFQRYIAGFPRGEKPTLLLDEIDQNLDVDHQQRFWSLIKYLSKDWQIIIVSHSVFAFMQDDVNHIKLSHRYFHNVRKLFNL